MKYIDSIYANCRSMHLIIWLVIKLEINTLPLTYYQLAPLTEPIYVPIEVSMSL